VAWQSLIVEVAAPEAEPLADALLEAGAQSVSIEDADAGTGREAPQFAEPGETLLPWPHNRIVALFDADAQPAAALAAALAAVGIKAGCRALPAFRVEPVADQDWVRATQVHFVPLRIADRLWVVPSWCEPPEPGAVNLRIDPGLAFGTGSHPTTQLVLAWLAGELRGWRRRAQRARVLDYGCGSGILAIAALKLGAGEAFGVDIDPQALVTSAENAACNDVGKSATALGLCLPDELPAFRADIVVANILARPLIVLAPLLAERAAGRIALSGILTAQAEEVLACYREWFALAVTAEQEGWVLLSGERR
jgi:ribosomal protein L11 methyltransferase